MFKNGTNLNRMENRAVKRNFYYIYQNSNYTNSIMEKNTDKVQKGNSQTNEKHTVGQSVKLSISNEGLEYS